MRRNSYARYVSIASLVISPDRNYLVAGKRPLSDRFHPGRISIPAGTMEGFERLEDALMREVNEETGLTVDLSTMQYLGNCVYGRGKFPVNQLCFAALATGTALRPRGDLVDLAWTSASDLFRVLPVNDAYYANYHKWVAVAIQKGLLIP